MKSIKYQWALGLPAPLVPATAVADMDKSTVTRADTKKTHVEVQVHVKGAADSQMVRLLQPSLKKNPTPFWVLHADDAVKNGNMEWTTSPYDFKVTVKVGGQARLCSVLEVRIDMPMYVNQDTIEEGDVLTIKEKPKRARLPA